MDQYFVILCNALVRRTNNLFAALRTTENALQHFVVQTKMSQYGVAHCSTQVALVCVILLSFAMQDRARLRSLFCFAIQGQARLPRLLCLLLFRVRICNPMSLCASLLVSYFLLYHVHGVVALRRANFLSKHLVLVNVLRGENLLVNLLV